MNKIIPRIGAAVVAIAVLLFAIFIIVDFSFGSYLVCMFLPLGYVFMVVGFYYECHKERRVAAMIGVVLSAVYSVLIFLVYFAQVTTVRLEELDSQVVKILDYQKGSLLFNYDLLGYGIMALSTFFIGLSMRAGCTMDKLLKFLLMIHGIFFVSCFIMPMTGVFINTENGEVSKGGIFALLFWCAYFFPIGLLAYIHFGKKE